MGKVGPNDVDGIDMADHARTHYCSVKRRTPGQYRPRVGEGTRRGRLHYCGNFGQRVLFLKSLFLLGRCLSGSSWGSAGSDRHY